MLWQVCPAAIEVVRYCARPSQSLDLDDPATHKPLSPLTPIEEVPNSDNEQGRSPSSISASNLEYRNRDPSPSSPNPFIILSWFQSAFPHIQFSPPISSQSRSLSNFVNLNLSNSNNPQNMPPAMNNANNLGPNGLPAILAIAKAQIEAAKDHLPKMYRSPPILDISDPLSAIQWLDAAETIFQANGISESEAKISLALQWSTYPTREVLKHLASVQQPNYDKFREELENLFPGVVQDPRGSMNQLKAVIEHLEPITLLDKGKLRLYNVMFRAECVKLMQDPAIISNRDAVRSYLIAFDDQARKIVFDQVRRDIRVSTIKNRREEDPIKLDEIIEAAEKVFGSSNFEAIYGLNTPDSSRVGSNNPLSHRRSPLSMPFTSGLPKTDHGYLKELKRIKQEDYDLDGAVTDLWKSVSKEDKDRLELERERLANQKDVNDAFMKEMRMMTTKFGESLGAISALVGAITQKGPNVDLSQERYRNNNPGPSNSGQRYNNSYTNTTPREMLCFMCRAKDHFLAQCPVYQDYIKRGWLVPEGDGSNRMKLRDDVRMPRDDVNTPRYKLIEDIAKSRGWDKAESYFANMIDEEEEEMNAQLGMGDQVQVLLRQLAEVKDALILSNQQRNEEVRQYDNQGIEKSRLPDRSSNIKNC
ncbi:hypothetical protein D9757_015529 [Collybiopsis confluens]|uniref:Uncharacterized protein n=1 Tax=Collybiopsis confluens TaxID=2823264 RepID=A0A8H5FEN5_9AGAR|nr:hypothetical protein D9757_015529 [Collybiopsis confluens]